ncbi:hypothetical protein DSUL_140024 [Desulfovibrionales bacterium]
MKRVLPPIISVEVYDLDMSTINSIRRREDGDKNGLEASI